MKNTKSYQMCALPQAIPELFVQVNKKGKINISDRYGLMAVILNNSLSEEERDAINRLLYAVRRGWLKVVDEL